MGYNDPYQQENTMPEDRNLELTSLVHALNARSSFCSKQLRDKLKAAPHSTHIEIRSEGAENLAWLLDTQAQLTAKLLEENASIYDRIDELVRKLEKG